MNNDGFVRCAIEGKSRAYQEIKINRFQGILKFWVEALLKEEYLFEEVHFYAFMIGESHYVVKSHPPLIVKLDIFNVNEFVAAYTAIELVSVLGIINKEKAELYFERLIKRTNRDTIIGYDIGRILNESDF